ncbi:hypothetical protein G7051_07585 [Dysgonomonas sp. HDW5B]|nr:hypothetical protein G7051_07585 [Dysgonomonas sp. HDW5B]
MTLVIGALGCAPAIFAQSSAFKGLEHLFTMPKNYVAGYTATPPVIDGNINDRVWQNAQWSESFEDIEGDLKPKPYYDTKVKMLWDSTYLYIAANLDDENVWAYLTERDQVVFFDNDFEVFINPVNTSHQYFEYEINALNTMFDLFLPKPYRSGSGALISWNSNRLKHGVHIYGSLNDPGDKDKGWTVELAIPFSDITVANIPNIPKNGDIWRINFSRVQWETEVSGDKYVKKCDSNNRVLPENNWVWSPQGIIDMHAPERWGYLQFSTNEPGTKLPEFVLPYSELQRQYLWLVYYKQRQYRGVNGKFAKNLKELGISENISIEGKQNKLRMESTSSQFSAIISAADSKEIRINDEGLIR